MANALTLEVRAPGNAAAMREALEEALKFLRTNRNGYFESRLIPQIEVALAASPESSSNAAALRAALVRIADMAPALGGFEEPVDGDSSAIYQGARCDGKKFIGKEIPAWWGAKWRQDLSNAIKTARAALAAPARNCDRFHGTNAIRDAFDAFAAETGNSDTKPGPFLDWLLAKAEGGKE